MPDGATFEEKDGSFVMTGPKGNVTVPHLAGIGVALDETGLNVSLEKDDRQARLNLGTSWSLLKNAAIGVTEGFVKKLEIQGVGYRAAMEGSTLNLSLGYSHPVRFESPEGVDLAVEKNVITVSGVNKEDVGQAAAVIRKFRKPEPYKGKGIRYQGEVVRMKAGKKAGK